MEPAAVRTTLVRIGYVDAAAQAPTEEQGIDSLDKSGSSQTTILRTYASCYAALVESFPEQSMMPVMLCQIQGSKLMLGLRLT